jgi:hypothetical protein
MFTGRPKEAEHTISNMDAGLSQWNVHIVSQLNVQVSSTSRQPNFVLISIGHYIPVCFMQFADSATIIYRVTSKTQKVVIGWNSADYLKLKYIRQR